MKKHVLVAAIPVVVALLAAHVSGQIWIPPAPPPDARPVLVARLEEMKTVLNLTDDQVKKITDLIATTEKGKKGLADEFAPVKADYDKAVADNDQAAIKAAVDKWNDLYKRQADINTKGGGDIDSFLTAGQRDQWHEYKFLKPILAAFESLNLTNDQVAKARGEFLRCLAEAKPEELQGSSLPGQLLMKLRKVIEKEVLTDEQRTKFVVDPVLRQYKKVELTDAQIAKIKDQAATLVKAAGPDDMLQSLSYKLSRFVPKEVLTLEQRVKTIVDPLLDFHKELTDEQIARVKEEAVKLLKEADLKADDQDVWSGGSASVSMKLSAFINKEVLTDEQKEKAYLDPAIDAYQKAELTDEQVAKIKEKYRTLAREGDAWQASFTVRTYIVREVLTDEQRAKMGIKLPK